MVAPAGWCMLEHRIPIAKAALCSIERKGAPGLDVDGVESMEAILQLDAVGSDVLYGRRSHHPGNQGQILQSGIALIQRPRDEVMPVLARPGLHDPVPIGFLHQAASGNFELEHQRAHIAGKDGVAAAAQGQPPLLQQLGTFMQGLQLGCTVHAQQLLGACGNAKGVAGVEGGVFFDAQDSHGG